MLDKVKQSLQEAIEAERTELEEQQKQLIDQSGL